MKNCFIVTALFLGLAFNNSSTTASFDNMFKNKIKQHIKEKKALAWWAPTSIPSLLQGFASARGMGDVDPKEIKLLLSLQESDINWALDVINLDEAQALAHTIYEKIKHIESSNQWHTAIYEEVSKSSAKKLFSDATLSRFEVTNKMYAEKETNAIKKIFIFGMIVTKSVEEMMKVKK